MIMRVPALEITQFTFLVIKKVINIAHVLLIFFKFLDTQKRES